MITNFKIYENSTDIDINTNLNQKYIDYLTDNLSIGIYKRSNSVKYLKIKFISGNSDDKKTNIIIGINGDTIEGNYYSNDNSIIVKINDELIYDVDYKDFNVKKLIDRIAKEYKKHLKENKWKIK